MVRLKEKVGAASKNVVQMRNVTGSIVYIVLFAFGKKKVTQSNSLLPMELSFRFEKKKRKKRRKKEEKKKMIIEEEEERRKKMDDDDDVILLL